MRKLTTVLTTAILAGAFATGASAHARLLRSDPRAGTTVAAPASLKLWFSETIVADKSSVKVTGTSGPAKVGKIIVDQRNPRLVMAPLSRKLSKGAYKVEWTMTTTDTHTMDGSFAFKVR